MIRVSAVRFFDVVAPVPRYLKYALIGAVLLGAWMMWLDPAQVDSGLGSVLLLQMFAASNGYAGSAARGWFDPLVVSGRPRTAIAYANLVSAAWPGAAAWLAIASIESAARDGAWPAALGAHRVAALAIVTTGSWAAGLRLPRGGAAMFWIAALLVFASTRSLLPEMATLQAPPALPLDLVKDSLACVVCPFLLLGDAPAVRDPHVTMSVVAVATACAVAGSAWIRARSLPLGCTS